MYFRSSMQFTSDERVVWKMSDGFKLKIEVPEVLEDQAKALTMPLAENAGTTLGDLWYLAMGWASQLAAKKRVKHSVALEQYKRELEEKLNAIPEERRIEPNTQVALNALVDSQSCVEEETLREMFANLIVAACDADKANAVHPAFSGIIKQLAPIDAELLQVFRNENDLPIVGMKLVGDGQHWEIYSNVFLANTAKYPPLVQASTVACWSMLGLIDVRYDVQFADQSMYDEFLATEEYRELAKTEKLYVAGTEVEYEVKNAELSKGKLILTAFGQRFLKVCM